MEPFPMSLEVYNGRRVSVAGITKLYVFLHSRQYSF